MKLLLRVGAHERLESGSETGRKGVELLFPVPFDFEDVDAILADGQADFELAGLLYKIQGRLVRKPGDAGGLRGAFFEIEGVARPIEQMDVGDAGLGGAAVRRWISIRDRTCRSPSAC